MISRQNFLIWLEESGRLEQFRVHTKRFYEVSEHKYVFSFLNKVEQASEELAPYASDFIALEEQRYRILHIDLSKEDDFLEKKKKAVEFTSLPDSEKRQCRFKMRPDLSQFLVTSEYDWTQVTDGKVAHKKGHYFFIPSFLPLMPKELHLTDFNVIFLDLLNFDEEFTYLEFFHLVRDTLELPDEKVDAMLLEFLSSQVLYFETIFYIPKKMSTKT
jgi:hypothetical protein